MACTSHSTITISYKTSVFCKVRLFCLFYIVCLSFELIVLLQELMALEILRAGYMKLPAPGSIIVFSNKSNNKVDYKVIFKNES